MLTTTYIPLVQQLLQNPSAPISLYTTSYITQCINIARGQLAGQGDCIRAIGTLTLTPGQRIYSFSSLNLGTASVTGIQGAIKINTIWVSVGLGQAWMRPRSWEWFGLYRLNNSTPAQAQPNEWTQYGQGAAPPGAPSGATYGGSIYVDPVPDQTYTLNCDCSCYPIPLAADTDPEAIPYLWTDSVPYFAAYLALLSAQSGARDTQASRMLQLYQQFVSRARQMATPSILPGDYEGQPNVTSPNLLGQAARPAGGAQR